MEDASGVFALLNVTIEDVNQPTRSRRRNRMISGCENVESNDSLDSELELLSALFIRMR